MSLFDEEDSKSSVSQIEYPSESGRSPMIVLPLLAVAAIIVALILFFGGRWVYRTIANDSPPAPTISESNSKSQGSSSTTPPPAAPAPTPTPQPATPPPSASGKSDLPNSGPSEVVALFLTISSVAAVMHYMVGLKRQNRSSF